MVFRESNDQDIALCEKLLADYPKVQVVDVKVVIHTGMVEVVINKGHENVSVDDCTLVSGILDEAPGFRERFGADSVINVCSPGLERPLTTRREMELFLGRDVKVLWLDNEKHPQTVIGRLDSCVGGEVSVVSESRDFRLKEQDIRHINLYFDINDNDIDCLTRSPE